MRATQTTAKGEKMKNQVNLGDGMTDGEFAEHLWDTIVAQGELDADARAAEAEEASGQDETL
jgi:hypothetical protein